ncbi:oxidase UstYa family protein [Microdochium nivale]|nr:oxidase UstYa family protein [Microdochium nivale]
MASSSRKHGRQDEQSVPFLGQEIEHYCDGSSASELDAEAAMPFKRSRYSFWLTYVNIVVFVVLVVTLLRVELDPRLRSSACATGPASPKNDAFKQPATSSWSPIFDWVDMSSQVTVVDGRLYAPSNISAYRGEPSPETDKAWDDLAAEANEVILVNSDTMRRAGFNPDHYFKAPSSWAKRSSTPDAVSPEANHNDLFPVQIDVFHQIHCLNAIRKQMDFNHYYGKKFPDGKPDNMHMMHMRHCLHMVLQSITCSSDVDIVPHRWVEKDQVPFAQFGITKQCRNFPELRRWNKQNAIFNVRDVWPHDKEMMPKDAFVWPEHGEDLDQVTYP